MPPIQDVSIEDCCVWANCLRTNWWQSDWSLHLGHFAVAIINGLQCLSHRWLVIYPQCYYIFPLFFYNIYCYMIIITRIMVSVACRAGTEYSCWSIWVISSSLCFCISILCVFMLFSFLCILICLSILIYELLVMSCNILLSCRTTIQYTLLDMTFLYNTVDLLMRVQTLSFCMQTIEMQIFLCSYWNL